MIKTYSQRLLPPYYGLAQIVESDHARAITMDGESWEIHFLKTINVVPNPPIPIPKPKGLLSRIADFFSNSDTEQQTNRPKPKPKQKRVFARVGSIKQSGLQELLSQKKEEVNFRIIELAKYLLTARLPFPQTDKYEYWLLDPKDNSPLALIYSCSKVEEMANFPTDSEWTALPAAVMPIEKTDDEQQNESAPVNYRLERLVAERAGTHPKARWFERSSDESINFPPFLVKEDWQDQEEYQLCQRYLQRQSSRLLMLHGLSIDDRKRLEMAARAQPLEVARFFPLYPDIADEKIMNTIRVEARLRQSSGEELHIIKY